MKTVFLAHIAVSVLLGLLVTSVVDLQSAGAFLIGALVSGVNVALIRWVWGLVLGKKSVAWPIAIIVLKYTLLVALIYSLTRTEVFSMLWFGFGLGSIGLAAIIYAFLAGRKSGSSL